MEYQNGQPLPGRAPAGAHGPDLKTISRRQVTVPLTIPFAQWSTVTAAAVIGLLVEGPVSSRVVLSMSIIATGLVVHVLGWHSGVWQTLVASGVFFVVTEIKLPSIAISRKLSEISFGIYLIHPAVYSILMTVAEPGAILSYALVIFLSSAAVYLLRRVAPILV